MSKIDKLAVSPILIEGHHDMNVNSEIAATWFAKVHAPGKHLVWFEHSGHMPMTEERGKFLLSLMQYARPLAIRAGDTPPEAP